MLIKNLIRLTLISASLFLIQPAVIAQNDGPELQLDLDKLIPEVPADEIIPPDMGVVPDPGPNPVPIDGGLSLLVAAGIGYGVKRVRDHRKAVARQQEDK